MKFESFLRFYHQKRKGKDKKEQERNEKDYGAYTVCEKIDNVRNDQNRNDHKLNEATERDDEHHEYYQIDFSKVPADEKVNNLNRQYRRINYRSNDYEAVTYDFNETLEDQEDENKNEPLKGMPKNPIVEGEITTIDIQRGCYDLGISIVGGTDTPLMCVVVQNLLHDGIAAKDGRLQSGDQILEVNGEDLTQATHTQARKALELLYSICRLTVYREKSEDNSPIEKEEILRISLVKQKGKQLGIKLVGKRHSPGLYIMDVIPESLAAQDNRLKRDDRILEINCQDLTFGTQEQAANIIQASVDKVQFVVSRRSRPQTPDLIRSTSHEQISGSLADDGALCKQCEEKHFTVAKDSKESLGISVAGGLESLRGDIPLYVTNIQANGCLGRSKQIKKGDVLLAINGTSLKSLTHKEAVKALKASADAKSVTLRTISSVESSDGITNFSPSWLYWLNLPKKCQIVKTITIQKGYSQSLGFSIVGGIDSTPGKQGIHVKSLVPGTPAFRDGRLKCGDIVLSVNGDDITNMTHAYVVQLLKNTKGLVTLDVV
ncbi:unnamed protein product, partial [Owenia fusiformis]